MSEYYKDQDLCTDTREKKIRRLYTDNQDLEFQLKQKDELLKSCAEEMKIVICGGDFDATPMANLILMIKENIGGE